MYAAILLLGALTGSASDGPATPTIIVVLGADGAPEYGDQFRTWAGRWTSASKTAGAKVIMIGPGADSDATQADSDEEPDSDRARLEQVLASEAKEGLAELWLVLIGHGTFDGRVARFNLRGTDVSDVELAGMMAPFRRPRVIVNCASSSGSFINRLSGADRVVITATRSGSEQNFCRFGDYFSAALDDTTADYDKDGQTSLLEAYLAASRRVAEIYRTESRLATEHALLDDNGDQLGTPADWFQGIRAVKRAKDGATLDGHRAHQFVLVRSAEEQKIPPDLVAERNRLELAVAQLREQKAELADDEYYGRLEALLLPLARLQQRISTPGKQLN